MGKIKKTLGIVGGIALASVVVAGTTFMTLKFDDVKKVVAGPVYSESEVNEKVEEEGQNKYEEGKQEGRDYEYNSQGIDLSDLKLTDFSVLNLTNEKSLLSSQEEDKPGIYLIDKIIKTKKQIFDKNLTELSFKLINENFYFIHSNGSKELFILNLKDCTFTKVSENMGTIRIVCQNEEDIVLSSNSYTTGIYKYSITKGSLVKIYDEGYNWIKVFEFSNGDLFLNNSIGNEMYYLDSNTYTVEILDEIKKDYSSIQEMSNGDCLLTSNSTICPGIYLFNHELLQVEQIYENGYGWNISKPAFDGKVIIASNRQNGSIDSSETGVFLFDPMSKSITKVIENGSGWATVNMSDGKIIIYANNPNFSQGLYLYKTELKQLFDKGAWKIESYKNNKIILYSTTSENQGIYSYDESSGNLIKIYSEGYYWSNRFELSNNDYLISSSYSLGVLYFNYKEESFTLLSNELGGSLSIHKVEDEEYLISSNSSKYTGLFKFSNQEKTLTNLFDQGYSFNTFKLLKSKNAILTSGRIAGIFVYDHETQNILRIHDKEYSWDISEELPNGDCVIVSSSTSSSGNFGIVFYDYSEKTSKVYSSGKFTQRFNQDGTIDWVGENGNVYTYNFDLEKLTLKKLM